MNDSFGKHPNDGNTSDCTNDTQGDARYDGDLKSGDDARYDSYPDDGRDARDSF